MSELTECNYCSLRKQQRAAEKAGMKISLVPAKEGGLDIYLHTPHSKPEKGRRVGWFMELSDHCVC